MESKASQPGTAMQFAKKIKTNIMYMHLSQPSLLFSQRTEMLKKYFVPSCYREREIKRSGRSLQRQGEFILHQGCAGTSPSEKLKDISPHCVRPHWMCLDALYSSCHNSESPVRLKDERSFAEVHSNYCLGALSLNQAKLSLGSR